MTWHFTTGWPGAVTDVEVQDGSTDRVAISNPSECGRDTKLALEAFRRFSEPQNSDDDLDRTDVLMQPAYRDIATAH